MSNSDKRTNKNLNLLKRFLDKTKSSPGREHEAAFIRLIIGFSVFFYTVYLNRDHPEVIFSVSTEIILYTLASICFLIWIYQDPHKNHLRYTISSFVDMTGLSYAMFLGDALGAALYPLFLWVIFGYGFRFGKRYLALTTVQSIVGFVVVYLNSNYWPQHQLLFNGLLIGLIVLPIYVSALLRRLEKSAEQAKVASKAKSQFLANMSHELRTPLNGISGSNDLLKNSSLTKEQEEYVETIEYSVTTLLGLIENILDLSKIEAGKKVISKVDFDLHYLMNTTIQMLRHHAQRKNLTLKLKIEPDVPYSLLGDENLTRQILVNLIGNAIKYTNEGGAIVKVYLKEKQDDKCKLRFEIIDTGIGIKEEKVKMIFERFTQLDDSDTRELEGSGLGTAIAYEVVKCLDGEIGVESEYGEGSVFWFELPFEIEKRDFSKNNDLNDARIILIDDENQSELAEILTNWGVTLVETHSASDAVNIINDMQAQKENIHAIIVSKGLIDINVSRFADEIRGKDVLKSLPLILVGQGIDRKMKKELVEAGFEYILNSPVDKTLLFNALHSSPLLMDAETNIEILAEHKNKIENKHFNILLAEDNEANQAILERMLVKSGHTVRIVNNGQEALDDLAVNKYDLCIMDMQMPVMGGVQAIKSYKENNPDSEMPFVVLTANATVDAIEKCKKAGADMYLTKPIRSAALLEAVDAVCVNNIVASDSENGVIDLDHLDCFDDKEFN